MKLPEPVAYELSAVKFANGNQLVYTVPATLSSYVKAEPLYSEAQVRETFEPVLKQALEALRSTDDHTQITAMIALEEALK